MTDAQALVKRAESFSKKSGLTLSTISTKILNDGKRLGELKTGKSRIWPDTLAAANAEMDKLEDEHRKAGAQ